MALARAAISAADPERLVREFFTLLEKRFPEATRNATEASGQSAVTSIQNSTAARESAGSAMEKNYGLSSYKRIFVLGAGKAAGFMARGVENALANAGPGQEVADRPGSTGPSVPVTDGLVVVKDGYGAPGLKQVRQVEASHPLPDERGAEAARGLLELAGRADKDDLVICLISGGGSALTSLPAPGISLADLRLTVDMLLKGGADIGEVNAVRKHLTMASAGRLAAAAFPAAVLTLIISDVIGNDLDVIASGPTVPDKSTFADALGVVERYSLKENFAPAVLARLEAGVRGEIKETPKPGDPVFARVENHVLCSNRDALDAAAEAASKLGYRVMKLEQPLIGEARDAALQLVAAAAEAAQTDSSAAAATEAVQAESFVPATTVARADSSADSNPTKMEPPFCLLAGGETTVTVKGDGKGGRAQEFTLAAALAIEDRRDMLVFAFGTDGSDCTTDAAGAMADGFTVARSRDLWLPPERHLEQNDAYTFFHKLGDLIVTGPTGTNVNDLYGVIVR